MPHSEPVQSVVRAVRILELVACREDGLSLRELCENLGLKGPTTHNLARTLVATGFIEKSERPVRYRLGPALPRLVREQSGHWQTRAALRVLRGLYELFGRWLQGQWTPADDLSLTFARAVGGEVVMALRIRRLRGGIVERPGTPFSPYSSAAALTVQAYWTAEEQQQYRRRHRFAEVGAYLWHTQGELEAFLARVRRVGYASPPLYDDRVVRLAAPVFGAGQEIVGALGLAIYRPVDAATKRRIIAQIKAAAGELTAAGSAGRSNGGAQL